MVLDDARQTNEEWLENALEEAGYSTGVAEDLSQYDGRIDIEDEGVRVDGYSFEDASDAAEYVNGEFEGIAEYLLLKAENTASSLEDTLEETDDTDFYDPGEAERVAGVTRDRGPGGRGPMTDGGYDQDRRNLALGELTETGKRILESVKENKN